MIPKNTQESESELSEAELAEIDDFVAPPAGWRVQIICRGQYYYAMAPSEEAIEEIATALLLKQYPLPISFVKSCTVTQTRDDVNTRFVVFDAQITGFPNTSRMILIAKYGKDIPHGYTESLP